MNAKDNLGSTPLHLAIKSADSFPNTRSIKELLIKGADRHIKDMNGKKPIDFCKDIQSAQL